jgi:hypothetical protein
MQLNALLTLGFPPAPELKSLNLAAYINSPDHSTKGTRSHFNGLSVLVGTRFQVLFHSPPGVLFTFPSRYSSAIGHQVVFRLGGWSPLLPTGFHVPRGTPDPPELPSAFAYEALTLCGRPSHAVPLAYLQSLSVSSTPPVSLQTVWPLPLSLATTYGISVDFFSSPYLDVSVQAVPRIHLCVQCMLRTYYRTRVSPFGNLRINGYLLLPAAYRSLSRPSSAPGAKASPLRPL